MATVEVAFAQVQLHSVTGTARVEIAEASVQHSQIISGPPPPAATVEVALAQVQLHAVGGGGVTVEIAAATVQLHQPAGGAGIRVEVSLANIQSAGALTYNDGLISMGGLSRPFVRRVSIGGQLKPPR